MRPSMNGYRVNAKSSTITHGAFERVGIGAPYTVAIAGDAEARTALLNCLAGQPLFDPARPRIAYPGPRPVKCP